MRGTKTELRPSVWRLRVYIGRAANGQPIQASRTFHGGVRKAEDELRKFVGEVEKSRHPERDATVQRLLEAWMAQLQRSAKPSTIEGYEGYIAKRIVPELGQVRIDRLTAAHLDRAYGRWLDAGLSAATVRTLHAILSAALHQAVKWEWLDRAPTERASPPSIERNLDRSISVDELAALIREAIEDTPPLAVAIALAAVTGARRGELCALHWSALDPGSATLTIADSLTVLKGGVMSTGTTKTGKLRRIGLDPTTLRLFEWWRTWQAQHAAAVGVDLVPDPYVLIPVEHSRGNRPILPATLTHQFRRLADKLELPYHFHELRHFAATTMIAGGIDPRMAATRLGHAHPHITLDIYAHAVAAADQHAATLLGAALPALPAWQEVSSGS